VALLESGAAREHPLAARHPVRLRWRLGNALHQATATRCAVGWRLQQHTADGDTEHTVAVLGRAPDHWRLALDGVQRSVSWARSERDPHTLWLQSLGDVWCVRDERLYAAQRASDSGDGQVRAAMNGRVVAVAVAVGQAVQRGDTVLTLEAMKMEHRHSANTSGVVHAVHVQAGDQVSAARVLVEIAPQASADTPTSP
jgi:geranyl-CoA carboxylase alpha subunit